MTGNHDKINSRFERAVTQLQDNLQYLADQGQVSDKFISMQNEVIKALIDYQHHAMEIIEDLQYENYQLALRKSMRYRELEDIRESFEAICVIHGIMDFVSWMQIGKQHLVTLAVDHYRSGEIQIPFKLMRIIDELSKDQRERVMDILNHKRREKMENELEAIRRQLENLQYART